MSSRQTIRNLTHAVIGQDGCLVIDCAQICSWCLQMICTSGPEIRYTAAFFLSANASENPDFRNAVKIRDNVPGF